MSKHILEFIIQRDRFVSVFFIAASLVASVISVSVLTPFASGVSAQSATQVSAGEDSACAVVDKKVKCWGSNTDGKLGNRTTNNATSPVPVDTKDGWSERKEARCNGLGNASVCLGQYIPAYTAEYPRSGLYNKSVSKVSVGRSHACAIANARVYCWGDNTHGQLGNPSVRLNSTVPIEVIAGKAGSVKVPGYCQGVELPVLGCAVLAVWVPEKTVNYPDSALRNKEIIDISAADNFTCALASDGIVSCWGEGDNGRLGTNNTTDRSVPTAVYTGGVMNGKKGIKLAKAAGATMCVLTAGTQDSSGIGSPYCWGYGIDDGRAIPGNTSSTTACNKDSPRTKPSGSSSTTIFDSAKPVVVSGAAIASMDGDGYITGLGSDSKAYYWGQYGYRQDVAYTNVVSCKYDCNGKKVAFEQQPKNKIILAAQGGGLNSTGSKNKKNGPGQGFNGKPGMATHTQYSGNDSSSCNTYTHYGYTKKATHTSVGKKVATTPPMWPQSQTGITILSGDVYGDAAHAGLFCAVASGTPRCDAHGGNTKSGQLGNGSNTQLSGPQNVVSSGWLAGKQINQLSTGGTGYTCALASGTVGCWGANNKGQLGVGDTNSKNVPTRVGI